MGPVKKTRQELEKENHKLNWEVGYYKRQAADRGAALSHHDKAVMKPHISQRSEDVVDRALFKFSVSHEDKLLDDTDVNVIPPSLVSEVKKLFQGPGHLASVNRFFSICGYNFLIASYVQLINFGMRN